MRKLDKKGNAVFNQMGGLAVAIAALAIALTVTFLIMSQARTEICSTEGLTNCGSNASSVALNSTTTLQNAVGDIPGWVPLIVIAVIGSILLGLVAMFRR